MDISSSTELKAVMMAAISSRKDLEIDLNRATDLDLTAVHLLWSAKRDAAKNGTSFVLVKVPEGVTRALQYMGVENFTAPVNPMTAAAPPAPSAVSSAELTEAKVESTMAATTTATTTEPTPAMTPETTIDLTTEPSAEVIAEVSAEANADVIAE